MPSSKQRQDVWFGRRAKTSGGLTKADLIKNKRGKLVSKKKSGQAHDQNNLGGYLRETGKKVEKDKMLRAKGDVKQEASEPKKKSGSGYVADAKVHADNIKLRKRKEKKPAVKEATDEEIEAAWEALLF